MAKVRKVEQEGFGEATPGEVISPLSFQNTFDKGTDSLHEVKPSTEYYEPPMDPLKLAKGESK